MDQGVAQLDVFPAVAAAKHGLWPKDQVGLGRSLISSEGEEQ